MTVAAALLMLHAAQAAKPMEVNDLLAKMHAAYQKIHSADITVKVQIGSPEKYASMTCRVRYVEPNLLYEDISESKTSDGSIPSMPGFTFISDGNETQTIGRADGKNGIKPFSRASVQDDGAPVYKETLCLWDWDRQWSGEKGGKASGFHYETAAPIVKGKQWIGLSETAPDKSESFQYYIDPDTYLIKRTLYYVPGDGKWMPVGNYVVTDFKPNVNIDKSIFKIQRG